MRKDNYISRENSFRKRVRKHKISPATTDRFYLVDFHKHIDEKISDDYDRVTCEFIDKDKRKFSRKFKVSLYKNGKMSMEIILHLQNMLAKRVSIKTDELDTKIVDLESLDEWDRMGYPYHSDIIEIYNIFYEFLTDNDVMEEEEIEVEEEQGAVEPIFLVESRIDRFKDFIKNLEKNTS